MATMTALDCPRALAHDRARCSQHSCVLRKKPSLVFLPVKGGLKLKA